MVDKLQRLADEHPGLYLAALCALVLIGSGAESFADMLF